MNIRQNKVRLDVSVEELEHILGGLDGLLSGELSLVVLGGEKDKIANLKERVFNKLYKQFN